MVVVVVFSSISGSTANDGGFGVVVVVMDGGVEFCIIISYWINKKWITAFGRILTPYFFDVNLLCLSFDMIGGANLISACSLFSTCTS